MRTAPSLLIAGFVIFMAGAMAWRIEYQAALVERMPILHAHRRRLRWIHSTMLVAMVVTPAGLAAAALQSRHPMVWAGAIAYAVGVVPWMLQLTFRLTVQERVAAVVATGEPIPDWYAPMEAWTAFGHRVHMLVSYGSAIPLAWGMVEAGLIPGWLGWAGAVWGVVFTLGWTVPRSRFVFEPPFWAHVFTFSIGIALL